MALARVLFFCFLQSLPVSVSAVPSPQSLGSDLSILTHNDLYGASSPRQAAVIVLSALQSHSQASSNCARLSETLWSPPNSSQDNGFLRYLDYGDHSFEQRLFWIGSQSHCQAITAGGQIQNASCDARLAALCSQSAPWSTHTAVETSSRWQTSVYTGDATIVGYRDRLSWRFQGVQYGIIPARFEYSTYSPPSGTVSALSYGAPCIQPYGDSTYREACLFLNIWTPYLPTSNSTSKKKAVMVWIHGGGFQTGTGSDPTFDGGNLASRGDVVLVTINYRLSTLGFLALSNTTLKGNYGIADQVTALDWLRAHIGDFGGDKDQITIFGQSAGAASVRALTASPKARGKFSGAIMQSDPAGLQYASTFSKYLTIAEATSLTKSILDETGCTQADKAASLACLRDVDAHELLAGTTAWYPVVDGTYLTSDELPLGRSAPSTGIALLIGNMGDDGAAFSKFSSSLNASQALTEQGFNATDILSSSLFPLPQSGNETLNLFNLTARVTTDAEFRCLGESTAFAGSTNSIFAIVFAYEFGRSYQIKEWSPNWPTCEATNTTERLYGDTRQPYFRCHSGDLYYVFGTILRQGRPLRDDDDVPFSQYIVDTWSAFAREKSPEPRADFLQARGYSNTSEIVQSVVGWNSVHGEQPKVRVLDRWPEDRDFDELEQCRVLGLPLDYYNR